MLPILEGPPRPWVERRFPFLSHERDDGCTEVFYLTVGPSDPIGPTEEFPVSFHPYSQG